MSGWCSGIHTGGAAFDCYLALVSPFVFSTLFFWNKRKTRLLSMALALAAVYALYVTYSRANYPAVVAMLLVTAWGLGLSGLRTVLQSHLPSQRSLCWSRRCWPAMSSAVANTSSRASAPSAKIWILALPTGEGRIYGYANTISAVVRHG